VNAPDAPPSAAVAVVAAMVTVGNAGAPTVVFAVAVLPSAKFACNVNPTPFKNIAF
jgi:hypothetical protein